MAKVKIQGNASGTGTLTLTAPNTNADRTITLPDGTGELLAKDSSGNLGIGTSSPSYPLDVYASGTAGIRVDAGNGWSNLHLKSSNPAGGGGSIYFENNSGTNIAQIFAYQNYSSPYMSLYVNNSEKMRIDSSGNVGIGTSSPAEKLDVNGSIKMANGYNLTWGDIYSNGAPTIYAVDSASSASNYIHISPKGNATSASGGVRINSAGNVGIGTDSPSEALDVSRSVNNDFTTLKISNTYGSTTANGSGTSLQFYGWDAGVTADIKSVRENQAYSPSYLSFETFGGNGNTGSNTLAERMRIDGYGNVGIGTSSPNAMLHVQGAGNVYGGNIQIGSGVVNTAKWSMITGAHYNEAKGICMMACYTDASSNVVHIGGDPYEANPATSINFHTHTSSTHTLGGTERMRIDSSGRVGIGTSNPSGSLEINGSGTGRPCLVLKGGNSTTGDLTIPKGEILQAGHWDEATTTFTQRMCIQADGDFGVGTNSNLVSSTSGGGFWINHSDVTAGNDYGVFARDNSSSSALFINKTNGDTTNNDMLDFRLDGSSKGHIDYNSGVIRYNTTSDYRLKDNITPMSGSIDRLKSLKPCNYNFLSDPDVIHDGFIAHEVQEVVVGAATGTKDGMTTEEYEVTPEVEAVLDADGNVTTEAVEAVMGTREVPDYQGIDQSKLVPLLVASLQEAIARIEQLENK